MNALVAVMDKKGGNAAEKVVVMLEILKHKSAEAFGLASPFTVKIENSVERLRDLNISAPVTIGHIFSRITATDKPQPIKLENATLIFEGRTYPTPVDVSDAEIFAEKIRSNPIKGAENFIKARDGDFTFVIAEPERLVAGRDAIGARPLYFGENENFVALASERKALWRIGLDKAYPFLPGNLLIVNKRGSKFLSIKTLTRRSAVNISMRDASEKIMFLLQSSVKARIAGLDSVAVAFSGGLDSSLIAFLTSKAEVDVHLIHVSLENQPETEYAIKVAEKLGLPIHVYTYNVDDVEKVLPIVLWLVEEPDQLKAEIGIPMYWTAEKTANIDVKVLLAGQGADELFGGYKRYATAYALYGEAKTEETMFTDISNVYGTNLERDYKICNFHNVELRLPFLTYDLAEFASNLPAKLKITLPDDGMRKLVLRNAAKKFGLPKLILEKPKRAIQYTTGVDKAIKKLAKKENLTIKEYLAKVFRQSFKEMMKNG